MKTIQFHILLISISMLFVACAACAQSFDNANSVYRIKAFQNGKLQNVSFSNEVNIIPAKVFYMPSAFSPNGDGLNETFGLVGEGILEYKIQIFNRWGNLIFESNDLGNQWDGYVNNEIAPTGVYVYKIIGQGQGPDGQSKSPISLNGTVNLVL